MKIHKVISWKEKNPKWWWKDNFRQFRKSNIWKKKSWLIVIFSRQLWGWGRGGGDEGGKSGKLRFKGHWTGGWGPKPMLTMIKGQIIETKWWWCQFLQTFFQVSLKDGGDVAKLSTEGGATNLKESGRESNRWNNSLSSSFAPFFAFFVPFVLFLWSQLAYWKAICIFQFFSFFSSISPFLLQSR